MLVRTQPFGMPVVPPVYCRRIGSSIEISISGSVLGCVPTSWLKSYRPSTCGSSTAPEGSWKAMTRLTAQSGFCSMAIALGAKAAMTTTVSAPLSLNWPVSSGTV